MQTIKYTEIARIRLDEIHTISFIDLMGYLNDKDGDTRRKVKALWVSGRRNNGEGNEHNS